MNLSIGSFAYERGLFDVAKPFLERVLTWTHSAELQLEVQEMLTEIGVSAAASTDPD